MKDTPSPQSVVVPVSAIVGFDVEEYVGGYEFRGDEGGYMPTDKEHELITDAIHGVMSELSCLAAPAPSSLAGGEVMNDDAPTYMRLAQALSRHPEVMVVERSDPTLELTPDSLKHLLEDVFPLAALYPEAPADDDDGPCTCCDDTGITIQTERPCACAAGIPFEAPAEGSGEDVAAELEDMANCMAPNDGAIPCLRKAAALIRARSSAPEAREEALGNLLAVIHGDGGHRALEVGTKQAALEAEKIVAGLFAAPSADKLRIAVEALKGARDPLSTAKMWGKRKGGCDGAVDKIDRALWGIKRALAALKAEG